MSTLKTNNVQVGQSVTATNNFTLYQPATPDGTVRLGVGNSGATTADVITATSAGNVGLGTSSPGEKLQVIGSVRLGSTGTAYSYQYSAGNTQTWLVNNATAGDVYLTSDTAQRMRMLTGVGFTWETASSGTAGASVSWTERARIALDGVFTFKGGSADLVLQATSTSRYWNHNKATSEGAGFTYYVFQQGGSGVGSITYNGSGVSYNTTSDYRLKEDIQPMTGALAKVAALKPCTYKWKADGSSGQGFIAHELAQVVPDCVNGEKDAMDADGNPQYQGIDTSFLVATLTAAIQELKAELDSVKAELVALKAV